MQQPPKQQITIDLPPEIAERVEIRRARFKRPEGDAPSRLTITLRRRFVIPLISVVTS